MRYNLFAILCSVITTAIGAPVSPYDVEIAAMQTNSEQIIQDYFKGESQKLPNLSKNDDSKLFVLISFSMPDSLIKQYISEAKKHRGNVVVSGLIDNDFMLTQQKIKELGGMLIDPNIFKTYKIENVPAIILTVDSYPCKSSACVAQAFDIMHGAVSVQYALEAFQETGDLKEPAKSHLAGRT